jgi:hypothetical protein
VASRWIAALAARIRRLAEAGDFAAVLEPSALYETTQLWEATRPADSDLHAMPSDGLTVLAYLQLLRYQLAPGENGLNDLHTALRLFAVLAVRAPDRVPDDIRNVLAAGHSAKTGDADEFTMDWALVISKYQKPRPLEAVDVAVTAFWGATAVTNPGSRDHALYQAELAGAFVTRFERYGDASDLDAAIDAGWRAVSASPPGEPELARYLSSLGASLSRRFDF